MKWNKMDNKQFKQIEEFIGQKLTKTNFEQFQNFVQLFNFYNSHTNLMSKNAQSLLFEKHIFDSLSLALFFQKYKISSTASLLDVGTGGGFPSIPLAIVYPDLKITPVDSIAKKIGFVELIQKELRLESMNPICKRVENFNDSIKNSFDLVTSRAVASLNVLLEYTVPFVKKDGYFVAFKSKNANDELNVAQNAMKVLNCQLVDVIQYNLPLKEDFTRELLVFKKIEKTSILYPRKSGLVRKNPL